MDNPIRVTISFCYIDKLIPSINYVWNSVQNVFGYELRKKERYDKQTRKKRGWIMFLSLDSYLLDCKFFGIIM